MAAGPVRPEDCTIVDSKSYSVDSNGMVPCLHLFGRPISAGSWVGRRGCAHPRLRLQGFAGHRDRSRPAQPLGPVTISQADAAIKSDPAHQPAVGEILPAAPRLRDALLWLVPVIDKPVQDTLDG